MIEKSDCSRDFSKEITKKYPDIHITIRNCNEFDNSLDFAKVSFYQSLKICQRSDHRRITKSLGCVADLSRSFIGQVD